MKAEVTKWKGKKKELVEKFLVEYKFDLFNKDEMNMCQGLCLTFFKTHKSTFRAVQKELKAK